MKKTKKNESKDSATEIVSTIGQEVIDENTINNNSNTELESVINFSNMDYDNLMDHLMKASKEIKDSQEVMYSKTYLTSLFEALVGLAEFQPERMEKTLLVIRFICNMIEYVLLSNEEDSMWDIDGEFSFPIPQEKIQMSLEGLVTPYDCEDEDMGFSGMDYDVLMEHLLEIMNEMDCSTGVPYSREYFTELFEALIGLSEFQPERMEKTLVILGLAFNQIELVRQSQGEEPLWGYDNDLYFPIPKEKIQMSLEGLETPYDWNGFEELDLEAESNVETLDEVD